MSLKAKIQQICEGRSGRLVYWCILAYSLIMLKATFTVEDLLQGDGVRLSFWEGQLIALLVVTGLTPYLIVTMRRCHDIGISYIILIFMILPGFNVVLAIFLGFVKKDFIRNVLKGGRASRRQYWYVAPVIFLEYFISRERASRLQYWCMVLITFLLAYPGQLILLNLANFLLQKYGSQHFDIVNHTVTFPWLFIVVMFYTISVRRCRDARISLWWLLLWLVPFVNIVFLIVLGCLTSSDARSSHAPPCAQRKT